MGAPILLALFQTRQLNKGQLSCGEVVKFQLFINALAAAANISTYGGGGLRVITGCYQVESPSSIYQALKPKYQQIYFNDISK